MTAAIDAMVFKSDDQYKVDQYLRVIHPGWSHPATGHKMLEWARQYRELYDVYAVGYIAYHSDEALTFFMLKWS